MNIVLAEERLGKQLTEQSFEKQLVLVGRDASECDIAFQKEQFPMVSRSHAEIRWHDNKWWINDLGSSYGTFHNEKRVTTPQELSFGDSIRFGTDGPTLKIVWFEVADVPSSHAVPALPVERHAAPSETPLRQETRKDPYAMLEASDGISTPVGESLFWLGREVGSDLVVETSPLVSRRHASIRSENGIRFISDNNSFNGTFLNGQLLSQPAQLADGDRITLGTGGPTFIYRTSPAGQQVRPETHTASDEPIEPKTMVAKFSTPFDKVTRAEHVSTVHFGSKQTLVVGRSPSSDIHLDSLQVSKTHARLLRTGDGFSIADTNSTNGIFVNGQRVAKAVVTPADEIIIGSFVLRVESTGAVSVFDPRSRTRVDILQLTAKSGRTAVIDDISFTIQPNEFVGVLGPSGAGKSTLLKLLSGARSPSGGRVLVNGNDLDWNLQALRQSIGSVPQDDIVHGELSVERTLSYVAKLRLSSDISSTEAHQIVDKVIELTGLVQRRKAAVAKLSGGQRKRVSVAVELITRPAVIYLDEPTSGLDPSTGDKMMTLFRELADTGHTVVMSTHTTENITLFDKIAVVSAGRLVYFGPPADALTFFGVPDFKRLFVRLESGEDPEGMMHNFQASPLYEEFVTRPLKGLAEVPSAPRPKKVRLGVFGSIRQFFILSCRYFEIFRKDRLNLFILIAQAPVIALLAFFAVGKLQSRDFIYFVLALVSVWFGTSVAAREIVRERRVYERERMFNVGILPYYGSKLFVLGAIVGIQCLLLFVPLKLLHLVGLFSMPGEYAGIPQLWTMLLTAAVGIALGLFISTAVKTNELATTLVPLILIPQILFSGIVGVPHGLSKVVSLTMPAAWSFDTMKRFSTLDTLEPEGADRNGKTRGLGLYEYVESENEKLAADARSSIDEYKKSGTFYGDEGSGLPDLDKIEKIPEDLSGYVTFLHPWMGDVLNQVVLMLMFGILAAFSLLVLRLRDIR